MTTVATVDQIQYLFTFPFKDEEWKRKTLIAFLLAIGGFIIQCIAACVIYNNHEQSMNKYLYIENRYPR